MTGRTYARLFGLPACIAAGWGLGRYWSTLCNEACSPDRIAAMLLLNLVLPLVAYLAVFEASAARPRRGLLRAYLGMLALCALAALWASFAA